MSRYLASVVAIACLGVMATFANASSSQTAAGDLQTFDVRHSSAVASSMQTKRRSVTVTISASLTRADGSKPLPIVRFAFTLPHGMRLRHELFPKCDWTKVTAKGTKACPRGSRIGNGSSTADVRPDYPKPVSAPIALFNGRLYDGKPGIILYERPVISSPIVWGLPLDRNGRRFGWRLEAAFPEATLPTLTKLELTIGRHYVRNPRTCAGSWAWKGSFTYQDGNRTVLTDDVPCEQRR